MKPLIALFTISFFLLSFSILSTIDLNYKIGKDFHVKIKGTSNVHDWESSVQELTGTANIIFGEDGTFQIEQCIVSIPVKSIKSSKGSIMDKKTWKALKYESHPIINYNLEKFNNVNRSSSGFTADTYGKLNIGGVTKSIQMKISGKELDNGGVEIIGSKALKMTMFGIKPPTALMGAMTTGDEVTIEFKVVLNQH